MQNPDQYDNNYYGSPEYNRNRYASGNYRNTERDLGDRAGDEVRSWFGDDEAERRRRMDERRDRQLSYDNRHVRPDYHTGSRSAFGQHQRSDSGRAHYGVPGLEPGDPNFGRRIHGHPYPSGQQNYYANDPRHYPHERDLLDQAGDEVRSWFGNREAARRREQDAYESERPAYNIYQDRNRYRDTGPDRDHGWSGNRW